jgi:type II secretory pathway component PulJ
MSMRDQSVRVRRGTAGHTLIEVMVASTLFVTFVAGLYEATGQFYSLVDVQSERTDMLMEMNVARSRMIADARGVTTVTCTGPGVLELSTPLAIVEYKSDGEHLVRWESTENKDYFVADHVALVECEDLGGGSVTVKVVFGDDPDVFALHVDLLEL